MRKLKKNKYLITAILTGKGGSKLKDKNVLNINGKPLLSYPCFCLLYTSPSPRDRTRSRMPSSA